jgi:SsrA-binding protein
MSIVQNKKAFHDYFIEDKFEAGIVLEGWEVKAIRDNRAQIKEAHVSPDNVRTRKLLLKGEEIVKLIGKVERAGYTLVPLDLHFKKGLIKCEIGLAKGKKQYDKRAVEKEKDWNREKSRIMRSANKGK